MTAVLIDTNAYAAFKQGLPDAVDIIQRAPQLVLSSIVIGELLAGFAVGAREERNRQELQQFLASTRVTVVATDERTAAYYAAIYRDLRAKGRPIPTNDLWIAATALQHGCALFSFDGHFQAVDGLIVGQQLRLLASRSVVATTTRYETEALLRFGAGALARAEVERVTSIVGINRRYQLPLRRSQAVLAQWDGVWRRRLNISKLRS